MTPLAQSWLGQQQVDAGPSIAFALLWFCLAAGLAFWGYRRAQDSGAPGWVGALTVFVVSMACSLIGGLLAVYVLVPIVAGLYPKRMGAPAPYAPAYAAPAQNYAPAGPVQPDAQGFVTCPGCGARGKTGRRSCMSCGASLTG